MTTNFKDPQTWKRIAFMVLFVVLWGVMEIVAGTVVVLLVLFTLIGVPRSERLVAFGAQLATYASQILRFLTYNSDTRPFPFSDWPSGESSADWPRTWPEQPPGQPR